MSSKILDAKDMSLRTPSLSRCGRTTPLTDTVLMTRNLSSLKSPNPENRRSRTAVVGSTSSVITKLW